MTNLMLIRQEEFGALQNVGLGFVVKLPEIPKLGAVVLDAVRVGAAQEGGGGLAG